ncbi:MAG: hypothetical protein AB1813_16895 [Verrucomicrobiota bacterium]|jgi:hypothetical protein
MSHRHALILLGLVLIALGVFEGGWLLLAVWLGADFLAVGIAHARGAHRIFGKKPDGTLPTWSCFLFLPFLLYTSVVWHLIRIVSSEPAHNHVTEALLVGRRLLPGEIDGAFANYVDLTAEFAEPPQIRGYPGYLSFPILDGSAPHPDALHDILNRIKPGRTYVHCAQGHGRTGLFALALMLKWGAVKTISEGMERLRRVRPGIHLSPSQHKCIEQFSERRDR